MTHLGDETLVELHFGDAAANVADEAQAHLAECAECRSRRDEITETLTAASTWSVPERGQDYADLVWARLEPRLGTGEGTRRLPVRRFSAFVGLAAALVVAFVLGRHTSAPVAPVPVATAQPPGVVRERILLVAVGDHLERSQMVLIELANAAGRPGGVDVSAERTAASDLVGEGRLFRQAAAHSGEPGVADVLDDLERVLIEVAQGPERLDTPALERLQKRIESQGLLFKMRVVGARVREREQDAVRARVDVRS
jgi:hypothetical protein